MKEVALSRLIVLLLLIVLLVLAINPEARQKAAAMVQNFEHKLSNTTVAVTTPSASDSDETSTPVPTVTPIATPVANNGDEIIPNTGGDQNERPIIQVNWDALNTALRKFWDSLRNIKINLNPQENR
jgi:hypothetical protein